MAQLTIKDIAKKLGISPSTVSRALRDHPDISPATKEKVAAFAARHNYQPNLLAKSLQNQRTNTIGVIVPEIRHYFFSAVVSGIEDVAYSNGYGIMVCQSNDTLEREVVNTQILASHRVAGMIVSVSQETDIFDHLKAVIGQGISLVFFDRVVDGVGASTVVVDDEEGAYTAVSHLIEQGYQRIAHLAGVQAISVSRDRLRGYCRALEDHGREVDPELIVYGRFHETDGQKGAEKLFSLMEPPDAIFAINDPVAVGVYLYCRDTGRTIPGDVALVGFSNNPVTSMMHPPITTVDQPAFAMGKAAMNLLFDQIHQDGQAQAVTKVLKTRLVIREST